MARALDSSFSMRIKLSVRRSLIPGIRLMAAFIFSTIPFMISAEDAPPLNPLKTATILNLKGEVEIQADADAKPVNALAGSVVQGKNILRTGKKSRAEIEFKDASIARLGSNTIFSFEPENRNLKLDEGSMLIQVLNPSGQCNVVTPAITAGITGTAALIEADEGGNTDFNLLGTESKNGIKVTHNSSGESMFVQPGQSTSSTVQKVGKDPVFKVKPFDVKQMWEKHDLGQKMGDLRKMGELKHIREAALRSPERNQVMGVRKEPEERQSEKNRETGGKIGEQREEAEERPGKENRQTRREEANPEKNSDEEKPKRENNFPRRHRRK